MTHIADKNRIKAIKKASWVAIIGNAVLGVLKLVIGIVSGSLAVVADAIDTITDNIYITNNRQQRIDVYTIVSE